MSFLVGLTGGIGSGKSTVAEMFARHGVRIIDTDHISHQLTQTGGAAMPLIQDAFGAPFVDSQGGLDRSRMRELVFADDSARKRLEAILHPLILAQARLEAAQPSDASYALVVVPLLFESGRYRDWLQRVVTVDCPEETQIARATQRSRLDAAAVRAIMARQLDRRERARLADEIIHNEGTLEDLQKQVDALHGRLVALATESD